MRMYIELNSVKDALNFVDTVSRFDCDVDMISGIHHIDAKSVLGVLGIGTNKKVMLDVHTEDTAIVQKDLQKYIA